MLIRSLIEQVKTKAVPVVREDCSQRFGVYRRDDIGFLSCDGLKYIEDAPQRLLRAALRQRTVLKIKGFKALRITCGQTKNIC